MPTVFIVDDDASIRESLSLLFRLAGLHPRTFADGRAFLATEAPEEPACVLLDLKMPGMDGIEVQERMQAQGWWVPVIFLTGKADVPTAVRAVQRGATDFLQKPGFETNELVKCVWDAIKRHEQQLSSDERDKAFRRGLPALSARELEVARFAAAGKTNMVIGLELGISERTVEVHRGRAMRKLGLRSAAELVRCWDRLLGESSIRKT
ncbi:response regulator [Aquisalimonas sp.]|uniref:response regulator transcription factor n=1 Tax=Aquisalimonas sp. TaxID=1872621 RepID=UPI0025C32A6D|nr:response regulator [Aquisalimonas sp.]